MCKLLFYSIIFILFILDICFFSLCEQPYLYSLPIMYILLLCIPHTLLSLIITGFFCSIESHLYYGYFGIPLVYLLPITYFTIKTNNFLYTSAWYPCILLFCCFIIQYLGIEQIIFGFKSDLGCTNIKIIANILIIISFSLIYTSQGKQGNRL